MRRIHYAGEHLLTGDAIADGVIAYAEALASVDRASSVEVPVRREDGGLGSVTILIGPASQMVSEAVTSEYDEVVDDELVAWLRERRDALRPIRALPVDEVDPRFVEFDA